jgi:hypothetical protein
MKNITLLLLSFFLFSFAFAQNKSEKIIKGKILDEKGDKVFHALVKVLQKDSLVNQGFTDTEGKFSICLEKEGIYEIVATYPPFTKMITGVSLQEIRDLGTIQLSSSELRCFAPYHNYNFNPPLFEKEAPSGLTLDASELRNMGLGR